MALANNVNATDQGFQSVNTTTGEWNGRTLTAGTGISIADGDGISGNPVISWTGTPQEVWIDISGTAPLTENTNYFVTGASTLTLPAGVSQGAKIQIIVATASSVVITANTGQVIQLSSQSSSSGGTMTNTATGDAMSLRFRSSSSRWHGLSFVGSWTPA